MRSLNFKILPGGLAVLLILSACSSVSPAMATLTAQSPLQAATETAVQVPATAAATLPAAADTASAVPATTKSIVGSLPLATSPSIHALDMLDDNNGWGLTDTGVVRTMDGGASWYNVTPAGLNGAPVAPFFLNATTAWLAAMGADPTTGALYHTTDGGASWSSVPVPFGGGSLHFVDPMNGWELVGLSAGMSHEAVAIYRTGDGGATWSKVFTDDPNTPGFSDSLPLVGDKNGISATDSQHAWVTGAQPSSNFIYIYSTQDGGTTWTHQDTSLPAGYSDAMTGPSLPIFFGASEAVLPVRLYANNNSAVFYVSHDGGQTWSATKPVAQGGFLSAGSATDFFVWDGGASLSASHDAGATWSTVTPNVNIQDNMNFMLFINATTGWALTADANGHCMLYKTDDGGATWSVLIP
jgi:photosystem II stability/assembly factor-like uncharacterized protein